MTQLHSKNLMHSRMLTDFSVMVSGCGVIQHMPCYHGAWCLISAHNLLSHPIANPTIIYQQSVAYVTYLYKILCLQVHIRSKHAVGYLTGQIQSLHGLCQQTNSECEYMLTLAWVRTCLIVHSLATSHEDHEYESDFWEWVDEGRMKGRTTDLLKALPGVGQNCNVCTSQTE